MNFELHMTLVETCVVAVWGLCWCNWFHSKCQAITWPIPLGDVQSCFDVSDCLRVSEYLSVCLSVWLSGWLAGWLAVCLSVCLRVCVLHYNMRRMAKNVLIWITILRGDGACFTCLHPSKTHLLHSDID